MMIKSYYEKIKKDFENGIKIENCVVAGFLNLYYNEVCKGADEDAFDLEVCKDLSERTPQLSQALDWFYEKGFDFNTEYDLFTPMGYAVTEADAPLVEYLIGHGAEVIGYDNLYNNYYMEMLDIQIIQNLRGKEHFSSILQVAKILAQNGVTYGKYHCIEINTEEKTVNISLPEYKY